MHSVRKKSLQINPSDRYICFACRASRQSTGRHSFERSSVPAKRLYSSRYGISVLRNDHPSPKFEARPTSASTHDRLHDHSLKHHKQRQAAPRAVRPTFTPCPPSQRRSPTHQLAHQAIETSRMHGHFAIGNTSKRRIKPQSCQPRGQTMRRLTTSTHTTQNNDVVLHLSQRKDGTAPGIREQLRQWQMEHADTKVPEVIVPEDELGDLPRNPSNSRDAHASRQGDATSIDQVLPESTAGFDQVADAVNTMHKGDLALLMSDGGSLSRGTLAVYVRSLQTYGQFYTINGRHVIGTTNNVQFVVPRWAPLEMVDRLVPYLPGLDSKKNVPGQGFTENNDQVDVPRHVGMPIINMLMAFARESHELYRKHAAALDDAHNLLAHETELRYGSLTSVATHLLQMDRKDLTPVAQHVVRVALAQAGHGFFFDGTSHRATGFLQIRSKAHVDTINDVVKMVRDWQDQLSAQANSSDAEQSMLRGIIPDFIHKVRQAVLKSRENRDPVEQRWVGLSKKTRTFSPTVNSVKTTYGKSFTSQQQTLLSFFEAWSCSRLFKGSGDLCAIPPSILKATGLYESEKYDTELGFLFLQEVGVVLPWENASRYNAHLMLPSSGHSAPLAKLAESLDGDASLGSDFEDSMADLRHDWGDLPVYCIDSRSAHEIDDGISIEPGQSLGERWIRLHIANPTAFLERNMPICRMARHMGETVYMPEGAQLMLPSRISQAYWSLAPDRPTLTISTRIDEQGNILERDIRPGRIHNVKHLDYSRVAAILGDTQQSPEDQVTLVVGGSVPSEQVDGHAHATITSEDIANLSTLADISRIRAQYRIRAGGLNMYQARSSTSVWTKWSGPGLSHQTLHLQSSKHVIGDPVICLQSQRHYNWFATGISDAAQVLVQEAMLLAIEVAASWCAERQIPIIYRSTQPPEDQVQNSLMHWEEVCKPAIQTYGELPLHLGLQHIHVTGGTQSSTQPGHHQVIGLPYYSKVTSPLRRYGDMITHWQIEAALREESRTGKSLITDDKSVNRSFLPFPREALQTFMVGYQARERTIAQNTRRSDAHWQAMLMFRVHHFNELKLPFDTFHVQITQDSYSGTTQWRCVIVELGIGAALRSSISDIETFGAYQQGDTWEAVIDHVSVYHTEILLKPIKLVHRYE